MRFCGVVPARDLLQLAMLEEVRAPEQPVQLAAAFFEPGHADQVAAELRAFPEVAVAVGAPLTSPSGGLGTRACDELLRERGVEPQPPHAEGARLGGSLAALGLFGGQGEREEGPVDPGAHREARLFETTPDGVLCALQGRRLPARRHPLGIELRIEELLRAGVLDDGGELRHRRIEELEAAAAALCAHRYASGHACWLGRPAEGVVVLPGATIPGRFATAGVLPPVERLKLPAVS